jgi:hypothetical protein
MERYLGLVQYHDGAGVRVEEQVVEYDEHLLLPGRELRQRDGIPVGQVHYDLAGLRYVDRLVDEDIVDYVLEDYDGLRQHCVGVHVGLEGGHDAYVPLPVLAQLVSGWREPVSRRDLRDEPCIRQEIHLGLQVLRNAVQLRVPLSGEP